MRDLECRTPVARHVRCEAGSARGKTPRTIGFHVLRDGKLNATNAPKDGAASALRFWTGSGFVMPVLAPSRWRELASELGFREQRATDDEAHQRFKRRQGSSLEGSCLAIAGHAVPGRLAPEHPCDDPASSERSDEDRFANLELLPHIVSPSCGAGDRDPCHRVSIPVGGGARRAATPAVLLSFACIARPMPSPRAGICPISCEELPDELTDSSALFAGLPMN